MSKDREKKGLREGAGGRKPLPPLSNSLPQPLMGGWQAGAGSPAAAALSPGKEGGLGGGQEPQVSDPPPPKPISNLVTVGLIGGAGVMGQWFKRFFEGRGLSVLVADLDTPQTPLEVAQASDVVILCVPIPEVAKVAREVAPYLKSDAALIDITSVKQAPMAAMLAAFPGEVVGTHPLFGPGEESINGRTVVLCRGRGERWFHWLKDLLAQSGARVKVTTAREHDRLMAVVQGLAHFVLIALGSAIRELGVPLEDLEDFATPTFSTLHSLTRRLASQDARLYACIQLQNPANRAALRALEDAVADILYCIQRQNVDGLVRLIEGIR